MGHALLVASTSDRLLRLRRLLEPIASVCANSDPSTVPMLAAALDARLAVIDVDSLHGGSLEDPSDRVTRAGLFIARVHAAAPRLHLVLIAGGLEIDDEAWAQI